jgi:hypothetical protein
VGSGSAIDLGRCAIAIARDETFLTQKRERRERPSGPLATRAS